MNLMDRVLHAGEGKIIRRLNRIVGQVNSIEEDYVAMHRDVMARQAAAVRPARGPPGPAAPPFVRRARPGARVTRTLDHLKITTG